MGTYFRLKENKEIAFKGPFRGKKAEDCFLYAGKPDAIFFNFHEQHII